MEHGDSRYAYRKAGYAHQGERKPYRCGSQERLHVKLSFYEKSFAGVHSEEIQGLGSALSQLTESFIYELYVVKQKCTT